MKRYFWLVAGIILMISGAYYIGASPSEIKRAGVQMMPYGEVISSLSGAAEFFIGLIMFGLSLGETKEAREIISGAFSKPRPG